MRCCARASAPPSDCLWITNDILSEAFNRYFQVNHTARRYGSNVPGPLEARRRLAKRSMGVCVSGGVVPPPPQADFGALFGLGERWPAHPEKSWKWEAPRRQAVSSDTSATSWEKRTRVEKLPAVTQEVRLAESFSIPPLKADGEARFACLLRERQSLQTIREHDLQPLIDFLQGPLNDSAHRLTLKLVEWLAGREMEPHVLERVIELICRKATLSTIGEDEICSIVMHYLSMKNALEVIPFLTDALSAAVWCSILPAVTGRILHLQSVESTRSQGDEMLRIWLQCLKPHGSLFSAAKPDSLAWQKFYRQLARHFRPSELGSYLGNLNPRVLAEVLLRFWAPRWIPALKDMITSVQSLEDSSMENLVLVNLGGDLHITLGTLLEAYDHNAMSSHTVGARTQPSDRPLVEVIGILARYGLPYQDLLCEILKIHERTWAPSHMKDYILALSRQRNVFIPTDAVVSVIHSFMDSDHLSHALLAFNAIPSVPLLECWELPLQLIGTKKFHGTDFFMMLNRRTRGCEDSLPTRTQPGLAITEPLIDLVHLVAYAYAKSPHINPSVALRRVWECYRFLRDRGAPLQKLMSRAFIRAAARRPLETEEQLSASKTEYIVSIVVQVEGEAAGREVDRLLFAIWRDGGTAPVKVGLHHRHMRDGKIWYMRTLDETRQLEADARWRIGMWHRKRVRARLDDKLSSSESMQGAAPLTQKSLSDDTALRAQHFDAGEASSSASDDSGHDVMPYVPSRLGRPKHEGSSPR